VKNIKPKSFSNSLSVSSIEPVRMAVTNKKFSPNPLGKPMQIAAIPKGFVNDLPSEKSLAKLSQNTISGTEHGVKDSNRDDLEALKKGYSSQVRRRIVDAKFYPRTARKREIEGKPVVEFELRSDGQLMNYLIVRSSSNKILDKAAIDAVKNASPYPGIPKLLKLNSIRFNLPISFILNEP
jgi:protein TonB